MMMLFYLFAVALSTSCRSQSPCGNGQTCFFDGPEKDGVCGPSNCSSCNAKGLKAGTLLQQLISGAGVTKALCEAFNEYTACLDGCSTCTSAYGTRVISITKGLLKDLDQTDTTTLGGCVITYPCNAYRCASFSGTCDAKTKKKADTTVCSKTTCDKTECCVAGDAKKKLSGGAIAGIVIGVIAFCALAGVGGYFLYKHLSKKKSKPAGSKKVRTDANRSKGKKKP
jgi:hypothetical protein